MTLSKEQLMKMQKNDLIDIILKSDSVSDKYDKLLVEIGQINKRFELLESKLSISENVNRLLVDRIKCVEADLYAAQQYSRRECLEISGIPVAKNREGVENVEHKVVSLLDKIDVSVNPETDIQACHRLSNKDKIIIKFTNRKTVHKIFQNKKKLKGISKENFDYPVNEKIFINESLCPHYRVILGRCNLLYKNKLISGFKTSNGLVMIQLSENGQYTKIIHGDDLKKQFPTFEFKDKKF